MTPSPRPSPRSRGEGNLLAAACFMLSAACHAQTGSLAITVTTPDGRPVADAVIVAVPHDAAAMANAKPRAEELAAALICLMRGMSIRMPGMPRLPFAPPKTDTILRLLRPICRSERRSCG